MTDKRSDKWDDFRPTASWAAPQIVAGTIVSVQPMTPPVGGIAFYRPQYGSVDRIPPAESFVGKFYHYGRYGIVVVIGVGNNGFLSVRALKTDETMTVLPVMLVDREEIKNEMQIIALAAEGYINDNDT